MKRAGKKAREFYVLRRKDAPMPAGYIECAVSVDHIGKGGEGEFILTREVLPPKPKRSERRKP